MKTCKNILMILIRNDSSIDDVVLRTTSIKIVGMFNHGAKLINRLRTPDEEICRTFIKWLEECWIYWAWRMKCDETWSWPTDSERQTKNFVEDCSNELDDVGLNKHNEWNVMEFRVDQQTQNDRRRNLSRILPMNSMMLNWSLLLDQQ